MWTSGVLTFTVEMHRTWGDVEVARIFPVVTNQHYSLSRCTLIQASFVGASLERNLVQDRSQSRTKDAQSSTDHLISNGYPTKNATSITFLFLNMFRLLGSSHIFPSQGSWELLWPCSVKCEDPSTRSGLVALKPEKIVRQNRGLNRGPNWNQIGAHGSVWLDCAVTSLWREPFINHSATITYHQYGGFSK